MEFFLNQLADVGTRITWQEKRHSRFLFEIRDLFEFKGEINNSWGMYALYIHSNGRTMKEFIERLVQYGVNVDSSDRDIIAYPNPFNFKIIFNGSGLNTQPVIQKKFKDIKYLKLETLTIPNNYTISKTALTITPDATLIKTYLNTNYNILSPNTTFSLVLSTGSTNITVVSNYKTGVNWLINYILNYDTANVFELNQGTIYNKYMIDANKKLSDYSLLYVYIPEIKSNNYTTGQVSGKDSVSFFIRQVGTNLAPNSYTLLNNIYPSMIFYKDSMLQSANKYSVKITDTSGNIISVDNLDSNANIAKCNCQTTIDYSCRCSYIRNPFYIKLQVDVQFKFGTFEDDLYKDLLNLNPAR
jgi:hypothetical protein